MAPLEVDVQTAAHLCTTAPDIQLLDVRESWERDICAVVKSLHIPMGEIPERAIELDKSKPVLVICHHGGRSMAVTRWLRSNGFPLASNVAGGIDLWAQEIDQDLARY